MARSKGKPSPIPKRLVALGGSMGAVEALRAVFGQLPEGLDAAFVIALQLLPPPETAVGLLAIARRELAGRSAAYDGTAVAVVAAYLE